MWPGESERAKAFGLSAHLIGNRECSTWNNWVDSPAFKQGCLFVLARVLFARSRFGEIRVIVLEFRVLVAVAELAVLVGIVRARLRRFLLDDALAYIAVMWSRVCHCE
jgi:hypothetical protein